MEQETLQMIMSTANSQRDDSAKARLLRLVQSQIKHDSDFCYMIELPEIPAGDTLAEKYHSNIQLFEDDKELRPGQSMHEDIRHLGRGRYSHWGKTLYFSSSDNVPPTSSPHTYHVLIPGVKGSERGGPKVHAAASLIYEDLKPFDRFLLAREVFCEIWPHTHLPDFGRLIDSDETFSEDFTRVSPESDLSYERKYNLNQLFKLIVNVPGDVAECGTYKGAAAYFLARHISTRRLEKRLCLFDSFEGLSRPSRVDGDWWQLGSMRASLEEVEGALSPVGLQFVDIYRGWIPERFAEVSNRRFSFVHIDLDLYQPTIDSLAFFYPRLSPGGIILFDDYGYVSCPGVTMAVDTFMSDKPEEVVNISAGGGFLIKIKL